MQEYSGRVCQPPEGYIVIAVARFNKSITQRLLDGAIAKLRQHNVLDQDINVVWVPGAYETPFVANHFAKDSKCLAVICLGAVIKGETSHDQHINRAVSMALWEIAANTGKPVIFGVLTCDTIEQANARSGLIESVKDKSINPAPGNKGAEAAEAALEMIDLVTELPTFKSSTSINVPEMIAKLMGDVITNDDDSNFVIEGFNDDDDEYGDGDEDDVEEDDYEFDDEEDDDFDEYGVAKNIFYVPKSPKQIKKTIKKITKKQQKKKKNK
ncbi:MAG: 6,7-dimethyl-8-ribityllumazine synthase [Planctomycetaceae bacterium]|jgi:6,7-dimethyl-8-ribityllumazine synthase|nr:6,7-dimethyl-8-ribityllumazine synthase [Planctomycetaceae bacterium]